jgi:hypothetical protein
MSEDSSSDYDAADIGSVLDFIPISCPTSRRPIWSRVPPSGPPWVPSAQARFGRKSLLIADAAIYAIGG